MTATIRSSELATTFEQLNEDATELIRGCADEKWRQSTMAEGWSVAATAHHLATVQRAFCGIVEKFAAGETHSPSMTIEEVHANNAKQAREFAEANASETLEILQTSRADMSRLIRAFDDEGLERIAGTFGDNEMRVGQFIEYVVIGHLREHIASIQETIAD